MEALTMLTINHPYPEALGERPTLAERLRLVLSECLPFSGARIVIAQLIGRRPPLRSVHAAEAYTGQTKLARLFRDAGLAPPKRWVSAIRLLPVVESLGAGLTLESAVHGTGMAAPECSQRMMLIFGLRPTAARAYTPTELFREWLLTDGVRPDGAR